MTAVAQFGKPTGAKLDPALKEFLDVVVIPALVRAYFLECGAENRLAIMPNNVRDSVTKESLSTEGVP
jgi:hypothetical protein